jgi:hypothetical protein
VSAPYHSDFDAAFADEATRFVDEDGHIVDVRRVALGTIDVDGVAIGDPLTGSVGEVPSPAGPVAGPGLAVELAVAAFDNGDERVAAARLQISDATVERWVEADAVLEVDAGTGAIASAAAVQALYEREDVGERILAELDSTYRATWSAAIVDAAGADVAVFSSGFGDGVYQGWWGLAADGTPVVLAVDFDLLTVAITDDFDIGRPQGRGRVACPELEARGVTTKVPWLHPRRLKVDGTGLPSGHRVYVRIRRQGETALDRIQHHGGMIGSTFYVDLSEVPDDADVVIRIATGYRAMSVAGSQ